MAPGLNFLASITAGRISIGSHALVSQGSYEIVREKRGCEGEGVRMVESVGVCHVVYLQQLLCRRSQAPIAIDATKEETLE